MVIVWISGGSSGIGSALVEAVPWRDARVINVSRSSHDRCDNLRADLSTPAGWSSLGSSFRRELEDGRASRAVYIHSAATIEPIGYAGEVDVDRYQRHIMLNGAAPPILGSLFLRAVTSAGIPGDLVMLTSGAADTVVMGWSGYGAAKALVNQWVRTVGEERQLRGSLCRVMAVSPGPVDTPMQQVVRTTDTYDLPRAKDFERLKSEGRLADPSVIAESIWQVVVNPANLNGQIVNLSAVW